MVDADQSGYIAWPLIGQNKGTLRTPADLSRVSHLQVYKCTEAGLNSCITVPSKVRAPKELTPGQAKRVHHFLQNGFSNYRSGILGTSPSKNSPGSDQL